MEDLILRGGGGGGDKIQSATSVPCAHTTLVLPCRVHALAMNTIINTSNEVIYM